MGRGRGRGRVAVDQEALKRACAEAARPIVQSLTQAGIADANASSADFRTGVYHRDHKSPHVGNTQPRYTGDVEDRDGYWPVGIVHPANYAAMRENMERNTLVKVVGRLRA